MLQVKARRPARHVRANNGESRRDLVTLLIRVKPTLDVSDGEGANSDSLLQFLRAPASALGGRQVLLHSPSEEDLLLIETTGHACSLLICVQSVHGRIDAEQFLPEGVGLGLKARSRSASRAGRATSIDWSCD